MVKKKWSEYIERKRVVQEVVKKKRAEGKENILVEVRSKDGFNSEPFWLRTKTEM